MAATAYVAATLAQNGQRRGAAPVARALRVNWTRWPESGLKPDCVLFERNDRKRDGARPREACTQAYFLEKLTDAR
jgi:hypothetical protein